MTYWVDKHLVPIGACKTALEKARQYPDAQTAWDNWDDGRELLWTLTRCHINDRPKLILCACEIAERVLPLFEAKYPDDNRPRKAIEAVRRCAEDDTEENRIAAHVTSNAAYAAARSAADAAAAAAAADAAARAANAARSAAYAAYAAALSAAGAYADADACGSESQA